MKKFSSFLFLMLLPLVLSGCFLNSDEETIASEENSEMISESGKNETSNSEEVEKTETEENIVVPSIEKEEVSSNETIDEENKDISLGKVERVLMEEKMGKLTQALENYKSLNGNLPFIENATEGGYIGNLNSEKLLEFVPDVESDENGNININGKILYYASTFDSKYYALGVTYDDNGTERNLIRTNFPVDPATWSLFPNKEKVFVDGGDEILYFEDEEISVSQGFLANKRGNDLVITLTSPMGVALNSPKQVEYLFNFNEFEVVGDFEKVKKHQTMLEFETGNLDIGEDSVSVGELKIVNKDGIAINDSFPEQYVLSMPMEL